MKLLAQELTIHAPAEVLFAHLTDAQLFVNWMAPEAQLDAVAGGTIRWTHANGDSCSGRFVELVPARRVVFTYGWERPEVEIPPGTTTVEIDLVAESPTTTRLRLVHRGLDDLASDAHRGGWRHYLARLAAVSEGRDPGRDLLAASRVPTPAELRGAS